MRFGRKLIVMLVAGSLMIGALAGCGTGGGSAEETVTDKYVAAVDTAWAYELAVELMGKYVNNEELGGRQAGSDAEHLAADYLAAKMEEIGLQDVSKDEFALDKWQFNGAELTIKEPAGESKVIKPYSYASGGTKAEGLDAELVYVGKGTLADYDDINVKGKIVLIDLNQREDWWVTYPTLQAAEKGAVAIINSNSAGYAELDDDTMNCQDFVGPVTIPSVNISRNDANYLKELLGKGKVNINLKVDNIVEPGGVAYNIVGKIPGKSDEQIIVGDHYDTHFWGFQDNNCAVAVTLAIAKAMIDSGYQPERTIVFVLHAAEEWGAIDTRYDWSTGAWNQVNTVRPDWVGKSLMYINFELPAYEFGSTTHVASTPEYYNFIAEFAKTSPQPEGCFPDGIATEGYQQATWSDDWSYTAAGIPAMVNGFLYDEKGEVYDFYKTTYHSQMDNPDTYNEKVMDFNIKFYGALAIAVDQVPVVPLDFTSQANRVKASVDEDAFAMAGYDAKDYMTAADTLAATAAAKYAEIAELNGLYAKLAADPEANAELMAKIMLETKAVNQELLAAYKTVQDGLLKLDWIDSAIVGHEHPQTNMLVLAGAIAKLEEGKVNDVVDNDLWLIEDEWYSYSFSRGVVQAFTDQVMAAKNKDNLFWGTGKVAGNVDLYDIIQSLLGKYDTEGPFKTEISQMTKILNSQKPLLVKLAAEEMLTMQTVEAQLAAIDIKPLIDEAKAVAGE
jgi:Iap family predicted aminopeptidase